MLLKPVILTPSWTDHYPSVIVMKIILNYNHRYDLAFTSTLVARNNHRYDMPSLCVQLSPAFFRTALPRSGRLSPGDGWDIVTWCCWVPNPCPHGTKLPQQLQLRDSNQRFPSVGPTLLTLCHEQGRRVTRSKNFPQIHRVAQQNIDQ